MEELLNKLIEKGWKPFGITCTDFIKGTGLEGIPSYCFNPHPHMGFPGGTRKYHRPSLRQIVSKESGLWQFCIKNGLIEIDNHIPTLWEKRYKAPGVESIYKNDIHFEKEFEYRLIESSLKDENELEDFLLNSIKLKHFNKDKKIEHILMEEDTLQELRDLGKI